MLMHPKDPCPGAACGPSLPGSMPKPGALWAVTLKAMYPEEVKLCETPGKQKEDLS